MTRITNEEVIARLESNEKLRLEFYDIILRNLILEREVISLIPPKTFESYKLVCLNEKAIQDFVFMNALLYKLDWEDYEEMEREYYENHPEECEPNDDESIWYLYWWRIPR